MNESNQDVAVAKAIPKQAHFWQQFSARRPGEEGGERRQPSGAHLAALRRGAGRVAGSVPAMWPLYTELTGSTGAITPRLRAEHHALVLYGFHQQSQQRAMHVPGVSIGAAAGALIATDSYSGAAVGRRFSAAATTDAVDELAVLLRGLVTQFRNEGIGIDYELLFQHLVSWQYPDSRARVRRRWGGDYFKAHIPQTDPPRS